MLFPRNEDWRNFHSPWLANSTGISPMKFCDVSPVKFSDSIRRLLHFSTVFLSRCQNTAVSLLDLNRSYYPFRWSPPTTQTTQSPSKVCKQINFSHSTPKKLFRPWIDDDDEEESESKKVDHDKIFRADHKTAKLIQPQSQSSNLISDQFTMKVQQLTETLTTSDDDDHSKTTLELIATNLGKSADGHRCIYCGKIYSRKYGLKIHLRTHTGFKPLKCKICHRPFGDPSNLNKHTRLHAESGAPLFQCHLCGKTLVRKRDLERHLNSRHPEDDEIDVERL